MTQNFDDFDTQIQSDENMATITDEEMAEFLES